MDKRERDRLELRTLCDLLCKIENKYSNIPVGYYDETFDLLIEQSMDEDELEQYVTDKNNSNYIIERYRDKDNYDANFMSTVYDVKFRCYELESRKHRKVKTKSKKNNKSRK